MWSVGIAPTGRTTFVLTMEKTQTNKHNILHLRHSGDNGVNRVHNTHHIVGFVIHGSLVVYSGHKTTRISKGEIYFLRVGTHYLEHITTSGRPYEELIIELSEPLLCTILREMSLAFGVNISPERATNPQPFTSEPTSSLLQTFFRGLASYLILDTLDPNGAMERMKINELLYLIFLRPTSDVRNQLALLSSHRQVLFEQIIRDNIFKDTSIAHLSALCNMSPSGFKREFCKHFGDSPHHWFLQQRLIAARALLLQTSDQVKSIARDCGFATASHFIRHFHHSFGTTPSEYRRFYTSKSSQSAHTHPSTATTTTPHLTSKT